MTSIEQLLELLDNVKYRYFSLEGAAKTTKSLYDTKVSELVNAREWEVSYKKIQQFFQAIGTDEQIKLQEWFEQVVTYGLQSVFGPMFRFVIIGPEIKANEVALSFKVIEQVGGVDHERDPYDEMGGGISDVLSFLLQFLVVYLLRGRLQPILFLDEAMKHLAVIYRPAVANLMAELVRRTGVQIIMVSHDPVFADAADVVYRFSKPNGETVIERQV